MRSIIILYFLVSPLFILAQLTSEDSTEIQGWIDIVNSDAHDSTRINHMIKWKHKVSNYDFVRDSSLARQMLSTASMNLKKEDLNQEEKRFFMIAMGKAYNEIGNMMRRFGYVDSSIVYFENCIKYHLKAENYSGVDGGYINRGHALADLGKRMEAIESYKTGIKYTHKTGNKKFRSYALMSLGGSYVGIQEYRTGLKYLFNSLELTKELDNDYGTAGNYLNIAGTYYELGKEDSAFYYYRKSIPHSTIIGQYNFLASAYNKMGGIYNIKGEQDSAEYYLMKAYDITEQHLPHFALAHIYTNLADFYGKFGNFSESYKYAQMAYEMGIASNDMTLLLTSLGRLHQACSKLNRFEEAYNYSQEYFELHLEATKEENIKEVLSIELESEFEKEKLADSLALVQEKEVEAMRYEKDLESEQLQRYILYIGLLGVLGLGVFAFIAYRRKRADNEIITNQKREAEQQREIIEEAHREITDSIAYAKRIQSAILPPEKITNQYLNDHFILYVPKDVVAGDFYWLETHQQGFSFASADCTGHGVPGAMVSVVCNSALNRAVREFKLTDPAEILNKTRELVIEEFRADESDNSTVKDGMDIALCTLNNNELTYAGAHNPLWVFRDGETIDVKTENEERIKKDLMEQKHFLEIKGDKQPIGQFENSKPFVSHKVSLKKGDLVYLFSDGFVDQFGGEKGKKFKAKSFRETLNKIANLSMADQKTELQKIFNTWKGDLEQVDDICVIGVRI